MIRGVVNENYEAVIPIQLRGSNSQWETVIDTGFEGAELMLPRATIRLLSLAQRGEMTMLLANERPETFNRYVAEVVWHGQFRRVNVLESENEYLASANLLAGSRICIDMAPGGIVTIDELPTS